MKHSFIIDVHTHIGATQSFRAYYASLDQFVQMMDLTGTQVALVISQAICESQFELGYRQAREAIERYPNRIKAYAVFDPNWPDVSMQYLETHLKEPGFIGVKIHPAFHQVDPRDARYRDFWAYAHEKGLAVLTHSWSPDPAKPTQNLATPDLFVPILEKYHNIRLILGHCGGREIGMRMAIDVMREFPNCCADLSGDSWGMGQLEWLVDQVGEDQLLLGTDCNWIEPRYVHAHVMKAALSPQVRLKILRNNALRLFGDHLGLFNSSVLQIND